MNTRYPVKGIVTLGTETTEGRTETYYLQLHLKEIRDPNPYKSFLDGLTHSIEHKSAKITITEEVYNGLRQMLADQQKQANPFPARLIFSGNLEISAETENH